MHKEYWAVALTWEALSNFKVPECCLIRLNEDTELGKNFPDYDLLACFETEDRRDGFEKTLENLGLANRCHFTRVNLPIKENLQSEICDFGGLPKVGFDFPDGNKSMVCLNEKCGCRSKISENIKDFYLDKFSLAQTFGKSLNYHILLMMQDDKVPWVTNEFIETVKEEINKSGLMKIL